MEKIVKWFMSCGYSESEATTEANKMIEANRWDGAEKCSREFARLLIVETAHTAVCRNCPTCTDETGHTMKGWLIL